LRGNLVPETDGFPAVMNGGVRRPMHSTLDWSQRFTTSMIRASGGDDRFTTRA